MVEMHESHSKCVRLDSPVTKLPYSNMICLICMILNACNNKTMLSALFYLPSSIFLANLPCKEIIY